MALSDSILSTAPVAGIAGPHQSTVATILRAAEMGLFSAAQAELLIDRVRAHVAAAPIELPSSVADGPPATGQRVHIGRPSTDPIGRSHRDTPSDVQDRGATP